MLIIVAIIFGNSLCITSQSICDTPKKPCVKKLNEFCCERPYRVYKNDSQSKICCDFGIKKDKTLSFQWRPADDGSKQIEVNSDLYWIGKFEMDLKLGNSYSDIAQLRPIKSRFMHKSRDRKGNNACILKGNLRNDKDVPVTVVGCPFSDTFQVNSYLNPYILKKLLGNSIFLVSNGRVTPYDGYPNGKSIVLVDEVLTSDIDVSGFHVSSKTLDLNRTYIPEYLELTLSLRYDRLFLENVCEGDHECAVNNVYVIVTLANTFYQAPDALGTRVFFNVKEIDYIDDNFRLEGFFIWKVGERAANASGNNPLSVDHYHYFTHDDGTLGPVGTASTFEFDYGNGTYGKNKGSLCLTEQYRRTAITEYNGQKDDWENQKLGAVQTFAHELGHAIGMQHDFVMKSFFESDPRYDSKGQDCLKMKGMMSYEANRTSWSTCSKEDMNGWFGELQYFGLDCYNRRFTPLTEESITNETTPIPFQPTKLNE